MGRNGRAAFLASFERDACCEQWAELMGELVGNRQPASMATHLPAVTITR
jgi:hypothetical protein